MATVAEQIELDQDLQDLLLRAQRIMKELQLSQDFARLLGQWDYCDSRSDFADFCGSLSAFIPMLLRRLAIAHPKKYDEAYPSWPTKLSRLLKLAVQGDISDKTLNAAGLDTKSSRIELEVMLDDVRRYEKPDNLVVWRNANITDWHREHCDSNDLEGCDPVMLSAFVFELDAFLENLLAVRDRFLLDESSLRLG